MSKAEVTETQKGALAENLVAAQLILGSHGRLSPFRPIADDMGIALLAYDKTTGKSVPLQVKSRTGIIKGTKTVHFEVRIPTFNRLVDGYVLAVLLGEGFRDVEGAWLVPMGELENLARKAGKKLVMTPSKDVKSRDKYRDYQYENLLKVAQRLIARLDSAK